MLFILFFFLLGIISIISQVTILRELIGQFYGNEFFVGIILGIWLLQAALGSWLGEKFLCRCQRHPDPDGKSGEGSPNYKNLTITLLILSFIFLPIQIFLIKIGFVKLFSLAVMPGIFVSILFIFFTLLPVCLSLGVLFPLGIKIFKKEGQSSKNLAGKAYLWETLGLTLGGLLYNFLLVNTSFPLPSKFNDHIIKQKLPNLVKTIYSKYGIINVTKENDQYNFYENGKLFTTTEETEAAEYKIHLVFAHAYSPEKILLVGNGFAQIGQILKYDTVKQVDYLELDPEIVKIAPEYLPPDLQEAFKDKRVKIIFSDPRLFLRQSNQKYDLVIFNLSNPSTAFINRLYTKEAFQLIESHLNFNGIFTFSINVPVDYLSEEAANFATLVNQTVKSVFPSVKILPQGNEILFLAADYDIAQESPENFEIRWKERNVKTNFFTLDYLNYRLSDPRIKRIENLLEKFSSSLVNSDFHPLAYFSQTTFWQTMYDFKLAKIFGQFSLLNFNLTLLLAVLALIVLFSWPLIKWPRKDGRTQQSCWERTSLIKVRNLNQFSLLSVAFIGFTLMTLEILIIYSFQVTLGYVFHRIALIFALILGGMTLGNYFSYHLNLKPLRLIFYTYFVFLIFYFLFLILIKVPHEFIFYFLSLTSGLLSGFIFPAASKIYKKVGNLYAADLLGAFCGSVLPSIFFIPLFGVYKTILFLLLINLAILIKLKKL